jgi:dethiobiotin synthetase
VAQHYFITGTDTNAGKTYVTSLLLQALRRSGSNAVGYKPVACGDRADAGAILDACVDAQLSLDEINPVYLKTPASPLVAGMLENRVVDVEALVLGFTTLAARYPTVLVEGAGGWEVPLAPKVTMADFAVRLGLPVILVVNNKLGALNHALLTLKAIQQAGLTCAGMILNYVADERDTASISNRAILEQFTEVPVLAEVMHGETEIDWPL